MFVVLSLQSCVNCGAVLSVKQDHHDSYMGINAVCFALPAFNYELCGGLVEFLALSI